MNYDPNARRGDPELVNALPGGSLWERWRLSIEEQFFDLSASYKAKKMAGGKDPVQGGNR